MNLAAIRHEATQEYCFCLRPGKFLFRLQTAKDECGPYLEVLNKVTDFTFSYPKGE